MPIIGAVASSALRISNSYDSIQTVYVSSGTLASVNFTDIPATYKHLQIRGIGRVNRAGYVQNGCQMRFNGDTASNYSFHQMYNTNGSSSGSEGYQDTTYANLGELPSANAPAGVFGTVLLDILDYANTNKYKVVREYGMNVRSSGSGQQGVNSGMWRNTNAITSISLSEPGSSWVQYTHFALYGIK